MTLKSALRLAIVLVALWLISLLSAVMVPLFAAYLLMLLWMPLHGRMSKALGATLAAMLCALITVVGPILILLPTGADLGRLGHFITQADFEALRAWVENVLTSLAERLPDDWRTRLEGLGFSKEKALERADDAAKILFGASQWLMGFFGGIFGIISMMVLMPIFLFYLLAGGPWLPRLRAELPGGWHARFDRLLPRIEDILCSFLRARFIVALTKGLIAYAVLFALGFPGAYTLAVLLGLFSVLPVVGPLIAFVAVALVGLIDGGRTGGGLTGVGAAAALSVSLELLEGYVLLPRIVGRGLGLSDFAVVLAMLFGGVLGGFFGVLVSVPVVAIGLVLYGEFLRPVMQDPSPARQE